MSKITITFPAVDNNNNKINIVEAESVGEAINILAAGRGYSYNINGGDFTNADLIGVSFTGIEFNTCTFTNAQIGAALLMDCKFINCDFTGADLNSTHFAHCEVVSSTFKDANLMDVSFTTRCLVRHVNFNIALRNSYGNVHVIDSNIQDCTVPWGYSYVNSHLVYVGFPEAAPVEDNFSISRTYLLHCQNAILLGIRSDGYNFYLLGKSIIKAGCRHFTLEEAYTHWGGQSYRRGTQLRREALAFLALAELRRT